MKNFQTIKNKIFQIEKELEELKTIVKKINEIENSRQLNDNEKHSKAYQLGKITALEETKNFLLDILF
jgi:hypothetical protein